MAELLLDMPGVNPREVANMSEDDKKKLVNQKYSLHKDYFPSKEYVE